MPSQLIAKTYYTVKEQGTARSIKRVQSQLKAAEFNADVDFKADTAKMVAETKAAIQEAKRGRHVINFETNRQAVDLQDYAHERQLERDQQNYISDLIGQGLRDQVAERLHQLKKVQAAEIAAYRANDREMAKVARNRLKQAKLDNIEMSRVLGSGQRPIRSSLMGASKAFGQARTDAIKLGLDVHPAERQMEEFRTRLLAIRAEIKPGVDMTEIRRKVTEIDFELAEMSRRRDIPVELRQNIIAELRVARAQLAENLAAMRADAIRPVRITVIGEARLAAAKAKIEEFKIRYKQPIEINARIKENIAQATAKLQAFKAAASFKLPNLAGVPAMIGAVTLALGPLAIALGGVTNALGGLVVGVGQAVGALGALPGLVGVLAGVLGTLKVGFSGVAGAVTAYRTAMKKDSAATAQTLSELNALREAQWNLLQTQKQGIDSVATAQKTADRAQLTLARATLTHNEALAKQKRLLDDIRISEESAAASVGETYKALREAQLSGDQTSINSAQAAYDSAVNDQQNTISDNKDKRAEAPIAAAEAENTYQDAVEQSKRAASDLADAQAQAAHANLLAKEAVTDAQIGQTKATEAATAAFKAAMDQLSPRAQELVNKIISLQDAWHGVKVAVQDALLVGAAGGLQKLSNTYLPIVQTGLVGIATALNGFGTEFTRVMTTPQSQASIKFLFDQISKAVEASSSWVGIFMDIVLKLLDQSAKLLPDMIDDFGHLLTVFDTFLTTAIKDGSFDAWVRNGVTALGDLVSLGWQFLKFVMNIASAMNQNGSSPLKTMADGLKRINDMIGVGTPGFDKLVKFFDQLSTAASLVFSDQFWSLAMTLLSGFGDTIQAIAPSLSDFAISFMTFLVGLQKSGLLQDILNGLLTVLTNVFTQLGKPEMLDLFQRLGDTILQLLTSKEAGDTISQFFETLAAVLPQVISALPGFVTQMLTLVTGVLQWLADHPDFAAKIVEFMLLMQVLLPPLIGLISTIALIIGNWEIAAAIAGIIEIGYMVLTFYNDIKNRDWDQLGTDIFAGILSMFLGPGAYPFLRDWVGKFVGWLKSLFEIHSPSELMRREISSFLVSGIMAGLDEIWSKLSGWGSTFIGWVSGLPARIAAASRGMWDGLVTAFKSAMNVIIDAWNNFGFGLKLPDKIGGVSVPFIGGKQFTVDTPNIPRLAGGGQIIVGEQARERLDIHQLHGTETTGEVTQRRQNDVMIGLLRQLVEKDPATLAVQMTATFVQETEARLKDLNKQLAQTGDLVSYIEARAKQLQHA